MGRSLKDATGNTTTVPTPVTPGTTYRRPHYQKQLLFSQGRRSRHRADAVPVKWRRKLDDDSDIGYTRYQLSETLASSMITFHDRHTLLAQSFQITKNKFKRIIV